MSPSQIAGAGLGASVGGTILSAFGAAQSGKAQSSMLQYQAGIAQLQKQVALQNRDYALGAGEQEALSYGLRARNRMGAITAGQGASGIDVGGASSVAVRKGQQTITDLDTATIRNNAARRAYGYETEAAVDEAQSGLYSRAASNVRKATGVNVAASLLSGAGSVSSKWLQGQTAGIWGGTSMPSQQGGMYWGDQSLPGFGEYKGT